MHRRLGSATLSQLAFPGEGNPNFPWEKSHWDNKVVKKNKVGGAEKFAFALGVESLDLLFSLLSGRVHVSEPSSGEETRVLSWTKYFKLCTYKNGTGDHSLLTH